MEHLLPLGAVFKTVTKTDARGRKNKSPRFTVDRWIVECSCGVFGTYHRNSSHDKTGQVTLSCGFTDKSCTNRSPHV